MFDHYILDGKRPVPEPDLLAWAAWFHTADTRVAATDLPGGVRVSTVFLGSDHGFHRVADPNRRPVLFETMIFGGEHDEWTDRYCTWEEAEAGHAAAVKLAEGGPQGGSEVKA